jgi:hypothetical protein
MSFDPWLAQAWNQHADDATAVAARLAEGAALACDDNQIAPFAHLAHHVLGEHLARWDEARSLLRALQARVQAGTAAAQALQRYLAALDLATGLAPAALGASDHIRALALAAASLAPHDTAAALALFQRALAAAETSALPDSDAFARSLAVSGNNLAAALEEKPQRSATERELMILAAQTGLRYWSVAGGWLETERAEYRLSHTWRHAGDPARAREHAQRCLDIVAANGNQALERFFGCEALGLADAAAGDAAGHAQALAQAEEAFQALEESERGWCRASLDALAAATPR